MFDAIKPLTLEAAIEVASNLRPDDRREVEEGHGHDPLLILPQAVDIPGSIYFTMPNNEIGGAGGIQENGAIWMLCTDAVERHPHAFVRLAKRYLDASPHPLTWNIVDKRNTVHLKLLKFLGFKFLRELTYGPNNLTFIEFCRVSSSSCSSS